MVDEGNLHEIFGKGTGLNVVVVRLGATAQEVERVGVVQAEFENLEDVAFRLENLLVGVSSVSHVDEVLNRRCHDFFVLGRDEHRGESDKLKLLERHNSERQEAVDDVDGKEEGFGEQAELVVNLDEPVDKNAAHLPLQVLLVVHVVRVGHGLLLREASVQNSSGQYFMHRCDACKNARRNLPRAPEGIQKSPRRIRKP